VLIVLFPLLNWMRIIRALENFWYHLFFMNIFCLINLWHHLLQSMRSHEKVFPSSISGNVKSSSYDFINSHSSKRIHLIMFKFNIFDILWYLRMISSWYWFLTYFVKFSVEVFCISVTLDLSFYDNDKLFVFFGL